MHNAEPQGAEWHEPEQDHAGGAVGRTLRHSGAWLVGADLLWLHISVFLVGGMAAFLTALIREPSDPNLPGWVFVWGVLIVLHATLVVFSGVVPTAPRLRSALDPELSGEESGATRKSRFAAPVVHTVTPADDSDESEERAESWQRAALTKVRQFPTLFTSNREAVPDAEADPSSSGVLGGMTLDEARRLLTGDEPVWRRLLRRSSDGVDGAGRDAERRGDQLGVESDRTAEPSASTWPLPAGRTNRPAPAGIRRTDAVRAVGDEGVSPWRAVSHPQSHTPPGPPRSLPVERPAEVSGRTDELPTLSSAFAASADPPLPNPKPISRNGHQADAAAGPPVTPTPSDRTIDQASKATAHSLLAAFGLNDRLAPVGSEGDTSDTPPDAEPEPDARQRPAQRQANQAPKQRSDQQKGQDPSS